MRTLGFATACSLAFVSTASAHEVLSARGPASEDAPSQTTVALGGGLIRLRDGRSTSDATTIPYVELFVLRPIATHVDFEARFTTTGATFGEIGGRVRFGDDRFSMGARLGGMLGISLRGVIDGLYVGGSVSTGTRSFQASVGLDLLWFESESRDDRTFSDVSRSNFEYRPFVGAEFAVGTSSSIYVRCLYYTRHGDPFFKYGSPALVVGVAW